jgi:hypothetical protein
MAKKNTSAAAVLDVDAFLSSESDTVTATATAMARVPAVEHQYEEETMSEDEVLVALEQTRQLHEALTRQLKELEDRTLRLYKRYQQFRDAELPSYGLDLPSSPPKDKRKIFNPMKYLKISAMRALGWAKDFGESAADAKARAITVVTASAQKRYADDPSVAPYLDKGTLPPELLEFIDVRAKEYAAENKN